MATSHTLWIALSPAHSLLLPPPRCCRCCACARGMRIRVFADARARLCVLACTCMCTLTPHPHLHLHPHPHPHTHAYTMCTSDEVPYSRLHHLLPLRHAHQESQFFERRSSDWTSWRVWRLHFCWPLGSLHAAQRCPLTMETSISAALDFCLATYPCRAWRRDCRLGAAPRPRRQTG